jgi:cobalamin biosynthesis Mg chelatase CobN
MEVGVVSLLKALRPGDLENWVEGLALAALASLEYHPGFGGGGRSCVVSEGSPSPTGSGVSKGREKSRYRSSSGMIVGSAGMVMGLAVVTATSMLWAIRISAGLAVIERSLESM